MSALKGFEAWELDDAQTPRNAFRAAIITILLDAIRDGEMTDAELAEDMGCSVGLIARWRAEAQRRSALSRVPAP